MESQVRKQGIVWGALLVFFGFLTLVEAFVNLPALVWVGALMLAGLGVLFIYLTDRSQWGLLILAYVLWAVGFLVALTMLRLLLCLLF